VAFLLLAVRLDDERLHVTDQGIGGADGGFPGLDDVGDAFERTEGAVKVLHVVSLSGSVEPLVALPDFAGGEGGGRVPAFGSLLGVVGGVAETVEARELVGGFRWLVGYVAGRVPKQQPDFELKCLRAGS